MSAYTRSQLVCTLMGMPATVSTRIDRPARVPDVGPFTRRSAETAEDYSQGGFVFKGGAIETPSATGKVRCTIAADGVGRADEGLPRAPRAGARDGRGAAVGPPRRGGPSQRPR